MNKLFSFFSLFLLLCISYTYAMDHTPGEAPPSYDAAQEHVRQTIALLKLNSKKGYAQLPEHDNDVSYDQADELPVDYEPAGAVGGAKKKNTFPTKKVRQSKQHLAVLLHTYYKYEDRQGTLERTGASTAVKTQQYEFKKAARAYAKALHAIKPEKSENEVLAWFMSLPIDDAGNTAAHIIARNHDTEWLEILAEMNAKLTRENHKGETPADVAHNRMFASSSAPKDTIAQPKKAAKQKMDKQGTADPLAKKAIKRYHTTSHATGEKWNVKRYNRFHAKLVELTQEKK